MYEKIEVCPSCKYTHFRNHMICKDYSVSGESFAIVECSKCGLYITNPRPNPESIGLYYKSENYISHTNKGNNLINRIYKIVRNISFERKFKLVQSYSTGLDVLDYGCGTGHFLRYIKKKGKEGIGVEPNVAASEIATEISGLEIFPNLGNIKKKFDVITAWHVLEHVHDLKGTIKLLKKRLKKDGYLFIAVPNIKSYDANYYKEHWAGLDVPRHFYHFSKESFKVLAKKTKLSILDIHPMKFDSYYVSLLSEKYKNGKNNYLNAYKLGRKSNQEAARTGEYSSLIYVLQK